MRKKVFLIIAMVALVACKNEGEVGRYAPMGDDGIKMLDTKTGRVYYAIYINQEFDCYYIDVISKAVEEDDN